MFNIGKKIPKPRCAGRDNGHPCPKNGRLRVHGKGKKYCRAHYERGLRKNGETRSEREMRSIEAKRQRRALRLALEKGIRT